MSTNKNLIDLIRVMKKWWKLILLVTSLAAAISIVVALMLPNYYKSTTIFYPQNLNAFDRGYLFGNESKERVQSLFGDKQDVNRVLSIATSSELIGEVIRTFNLAAHYDIDTTARLWEYKVRKEFDNNFKVIKTDLDNIELSVWDQDPELAAEIANYFVKRINEIYAGLLQKRNVKNEAIVSEQVQKLEQQLAAINDSLRAISDTSTAEYRMLRSMQANMLEDYNNWKTLNIQYEAAANYDLNSLFIIENAYAAEKKDRPVRWIIVVSTVLAAFFLSLLTAILIEQYKSIREEL